MSLDNWRCNRGLKFVDAVAKRFFVRQLDLPRWVGGGIAHELFRAHNTCCADCAKPPARIGMCMFEECRALLLLFAHALIVDERFTSLAHLFL